MIKIYKSRKKEKIKIGLILASVMILLFSTGCTTQGKIKKNDEKNKTYIVDLNGDGVKEIVETEDKSSTNSLSIVTIKNKKGAEINSFSIPGKVQKVEFADLNNDKIKQIAVHSEDEEGITTLAIYQSNDDKFYKIFSVSSAHIIDTDFGLVSRIKVGKASRHSSNSSNFSLDWDKWIWAGNKFVME